MTRRNFGSVLLRNARQCAERTGVPVRIVIDNGPINHCFFTSEARKLGFRVTEPTCEQTTHEAIMVSSKRLRGGW
ncbi:MAG: hypothetical protein U9P50_02960 [Patescibacteria group bacterium]|nr:hypothetical protein [Patescibacteria group bacterium]